MKDTRYYVASTDDYGVFTVIDVLDVHGDGPANELRVTALAAAIPEAIYFAVAPPYPEKPFEYEATHVSRNAETTAMCLFTTPFMLVNEGGHSWLADPDEWEVIE